MCQEHVLDDPRRFLRLAQSTYDQVMASPGLLSRVSVCLLCLGDSDYMVVHVPRDPAALNLGRPPEGKVRTVVLGLCACCLQSCTPEEAEEAIRRAGMEISN